MQYCIQNIYHINYSTKWNFELLNVGHMTKTKVNKCSRYRSFFWFF